MPNLVHVYSWQLTSLHMSAWDEVTLTAKMDGKVTVWPFVVVEKVGPRADLIGPWDRLALVGPRLGTRWS